MPGLVVSGSPTFNPDGSCTINATGADLVAAPAPDETQGWLAMRSRMGFSSLDASGNRYLYNLGDDVNNRISVGHSAGVESLFVARVAGGIADVRDFVASWNVADRLTTVVAWSATAIRISIGGAPFQAVASAHIPALLTALVNIGTFDATFGFSNSDVFWAAGGSGLLSDADAATFHSFGDADPEPWLLPGSPIFLWTAEDTNYVDDFTPPPPPGTVVSRPQTTVEVSWASRPAGVFVIGSSLLDSTDQLGVTAFDESWDGPYDLLDGSDPAFRARAIRWEVTQGRSTTLAEAEAGTSTIDVRDPRGLLNPENPLSPLVDDLTARLHPVRIRSTFAGVTYGIYYGWVRSIQWEPHGRRGTAQLECIDLFWRLSRFKPTIAATGVTTTGAAIGLILDSIGWTDPALRSLGVGDSIPNFVAAGDRTALQLINELLDAERGLFFQRGDSVVVYESRNQRLGRVSSGVIADRMNAVVPGVDAESVRTKARVTRVGGVAQTFEDVDASARWSATDAEEIQTPYLNTDTEALNLATFIVESMKDPIAPVRDVTIRNADDDLLVHLLARQPGDRMTLSTSHPGGGMRDDYYIERRVVSRDEQDHYQARWTVAKAAAGSPFVIDSSTLDGAAALAF